VGVRFAATTLAGIRAAFTALAALHACRIFHGDARTANLLNIEGQAMWIDLRTGIVKAGGAVALPLEQQAYDAAVLARSMIPQPLPLPPPVQEALKLYNAAVPSTVLALAQAVWGAF
jgi:tRNA A-37 threonylcarbamoyl transferase component Bud32